MVVDPSWRLRVAVSRMIALWPFYGFATSSAVDVAIGGEPYESWRSFVATALVTICFFNTAIIGIGMLLIAAVSRVNRRIRGWIDRVVVRFAVPNLIAGLLCSFLGALHILCVGAMSGFQFTTQQGEPPEWIVNIAFYVHQWPWPYLASIAVWILGAMLLATNDIMPQSGVCKCGYSVGESMNECPECGRVVLTCCTQSQDTTNVSPLVDQAAARK